MAHERESTALDAAVELLNEEGLEALPRALEILLNAAMKAERSAHLGAEPHERTAARRGYANGFKPKGVKSRVGALDLRVPQVRDAETPFYPKSLEKGLRSERALKLAVAEMYVQGVSTRRVRSVVEELCGLEVSSSEVSRATALLDEELERWRTRSLGKIRYLILDARYEKVRHGGSVVDCAVLIAMGVRDDDGRRTLLGTSVSLSEAEVHWRAFLSSLQERGMHGVELVTSDDHAGLTAALKSRMTGVPWQRCQCHLQRNAMAYVPKVSMRAEVAADIRSVFDAPDRASADDRLKTVVTRYATRAPRLSEWMEENLPQGLTVIDLPSPHRKRLRTTNGLERVNKEVKRRTAVATLFPNEASLLRLVSAMLAEISEDWETGRVYLNMESGPRG